MIPPTVSKSTPLSASLIALACVMLVPAHAWAQSPGGNRPAEPVVLAWSVGLAAGALAGLGAYLFVRNISLKRLKRRWVVSVKGGERPASAYKAAQETERWFLIIAGSAAVLLSFGAFFIGLYGLIMSA